MDFSDEQYLELEKRKTSSKICLQHNRKSVNQAKRTNTRKNKEKIKSPSKIDGGYIAPPEIKNKTTSIKYGKISLNATTTAR